MRYVLLCSFLLSFTSQLPAQHYLTFGVGYANVFLISDELDQLKDTYNYVNSASMNRYLVGFNSADGVCVEAGYRYLEKRSAAITLGYQRSSTFDAGSYNNGAGRQLDLTIEHFFIDSEYGIRRNNYFFNGLLSMNFFRDLELDSQYTGDTEDLERPLTGTFTSDVNFSLGAGLSLGVHKEPFMLIGKIVFPVYNLNAKDDLIADDALGSRRFPTDFIDYHNALPFESLSNSDLDGLKVMLGFYVALAILD